MDLFGSLAPSIVTGVLGGLVLLVVILFIQWLFNRLTHRRRGKRGKKKDYDMKALVFDEAGRKIKEIYLRRIVGNLYGSLNTDEPMFFTKLSDEHIFIDKDGVETVPATVHANWLVPISPRLDSTVSMIKNSDQESLVRLMHEDFVGFISKLLEEQGEKKGVVTVPGVGKIGFTFKPRELGRSYLDYVLGTGIMTVRHTFAVSKEMDEFAKYLEARARYEKARAGRWMVYATAIAMVLIAMAIVVALAPK